MVCSREVTVMATGVARERETPPPDSPEKRSVWTRWWMILIYAVAGVSALAIVSLVVAQAGGDEAAETFEDAANAAAPEGYVLFDAAGAGYRIVHPADWVKGGPAEWPPDEWDPDSGWSVTGPDGDGLFMDPIELGPRDTIEFAENDLMPSLVEGLGASLLSLQRVTVAGYDSLLTVYRYEGHHVEQLWVAPREEHYYIVFVSDSIGYGILVTFVDPQASDQQIAETISSSFQVLTN